MKVRFLSQKNREENWRFKERQTKVAHLLYAIIQRLMCNKQGVCSHDQLQSWT
jgi:hypothetical protein